MFYFNERSFLLQSVMFLLLVILSPTLLLINAKTFVVKTRNSGRQTFESPIALNSISLDAEDVSHNYSLKLSSPGGTRKRLRNFSVRLHHDKPEEEEDNRDITEEDKKTRNIKHNAGDYIDGSGVSNDYDDYDDDDYDEMRIMLPGEWMSDVYYDDNGHDYGKY